LVVALPCATETTELRGDGESKVVYGLLLVGGRTSDIEGTIRSAKDLSIDPRGEIKS